MRKLLASLLFFVFSLTAVAQFAPDYVRRNYGTATGTNTYAVTSTPAQQAYVYGQVYVVTFTNANTSAATLNINGLGAKTIQLAGSALTSGQIAAGSTVDLVYDGTNLQIIGSSSSGGSGTVTSIATSSPITGGTITTTGTIGIGNAAADGSTKGASTYTAADFNDNGSGLISLDYTNGQAADASHKGYLTSTDWSTFNGKGSGTVTTTGSPASGNLTKFSGSTSITNGDLSGDVTTSGTLATTIANNAVSTAKINDNAVTLAKLATQADGTLLGNFSGGSAVPTAGTPDSFLIQRTYIATSTSGTATYTATAAPAPTAYVTGAQYSVTFTSTNTGASTLNLNSLGAKNIKLNGNPVAAGQLVGGATYQMIYDGTQFNVTGGGGVTFVYPSVTSLLYGWSDSDDLVEWVGTGGSFSGGIKTNFSTVGTGAGIGNVLEKGHPGVLGAGVGTTNASGRVIFMFAANAISGANGVLQLDQGGGSDQVWYFKTDATLSNGTNRYSIAGGWGDNAFSNGGSNKAVWNYIDNVNSGAFQIQVISGGVTQTAVNGSTTVLASTWYRMRLNINAAYTAITLYISVGTVSAGVTTWAAEYQDCQYTGTMPVNTVGYSGSLYINRGTGAGNSSMSVDGWEAAVYLASPRGGDLLPESVLPHHFKAANDELYRIAA